MKFEIPIIKNTEFDLSRFDFSIASIRIIDIESEEFATYIKLLNPNFEQANFNFFLSEIEKAKIENNKRYAIVKNNYKEFTKQEIYNVYYLLLIILPSGIKIESIVHYTDENNFVQRSFMSSLENHYTNVENYLYFDDEYLEEVNEYITLVFNRINFNNYIGLSIENYLNSFNVSHLHFSYLALCISLENLISGPQELSYRLKRCVSILCGNNELVSNIIFNNLSKIYNLRSKIVHGEQYSSADIYSKIEYLQYLVSRVLIELLIHNLPNNKDLDSIITKIGFGQRVAISENWKQYKLNPMTFYKIRTVLN